jgi:diguanylate cyclase (GGDEF)-like protein
LNNRKYIVESLVDITEQKILEEKLHTQSITDDMTGLLNRRGFLMMARKQLKIADRSQKPLSLLFADVDKLKFINDNFGHESGDKMLIHASKILSSFRSSDIVGRLGGDEFAVLIIGDEVEESKAHIEKRFSNLLEETNTQLADRFKLSISYGVVRYDPAQPCSIEELLSEADTLMYDSKKEKQSV